jgi:tRNA threonylcarbamoyladenosine modification (KEOPS) complex  Pcc1 subunit
MKAKLTFTFPSSKAAGDALAALQQETEFKRRARASLFQKGRDLIIKINADDIIALRATVNAYLRGIQVIKAIERG